MSWLSPFMRSSPRWRWGRPRSKRLFLLVSTSQGAGRHAKGWPAYVLGSVVLQGQGETPTHRPGPQRNPPPQKAPTTHPPNHPERPHPMPHPNPPPKSPPLKAPPQKTSAQSKANLPKPTLDVCQEGLVRGHHHQPRQRRLEGAVLALPDGAAQLDDALHAGHRRLDARVPLVGLWFGRFFWGGGDGFFFGDALGR